MCSKKSPCLTVGSENVNHLFWVSSTVSLFYSFKFIFQINCLCVARFETLSLPPAVHYNILMSIFTLNPQQLFAASVKPQYSCPLQVCKRFQCVKLLWHFFQACEFVFPDKLFVTTYSCIDLKKLFSIKIFLLKMGVWKKSSLWVTAIFLLFLWKIKKSTFF